MIDFIRYWQPARWVLVRIAISLRGTKPGDALTEFLYPDDAMIRFL